MLHHLVNLTHRVHFSITQPQVCLLLMQKKVFCCANLWPAEPTLRKRCYPSRLLLFLARSKWHLRMLSFQKSVICLYHLLTSPNTCLTAIRKATENTLPYIEHRRMKKKEKNLTGQEQSKICTTHPSTTVSHIQTDKGWDCEIDICSFLTDEYLFRTHNSIQK